MIGLSWFCLIEPLWLLESQSLPVLSSHWAWKGRFTNLPIPWNPEMISMTLTLFLSYSHWCSYHFHVGLYFWKTCRWKHCFKRWRSGISELMGSADTAQDRFGLRLPGTRKVWRFLFKTKMFMMTSCILIILTVWFLFLSDGWINSVLEYGQKLVTDSLHTLGTNIKKRLHGQLMETDLEDPDVFTFPDNSKQPFKTYINDDIVRVSPNNLFHCILAASYTNHRLPTIVTEGSYCKVSL